MKAADLTVYANLDENDLDHPPRVQRINYAYDYLNWVHIPGRPGFPYETNITFRFEKDNARPTSTEVGNDREIIISIQGSWTALEEQLVVPTWIGPPRDLDSVDWTASPSTVPGMEVISFDPAGRSDNLARDFDKKNEVYISRQGEHITSFMICHKKGAYRVPHCELRVNVAPLTAKIRFRRHLLTDFAGVRAQAQDFVTCLMAGETRIPATYRDPQ